jgi:transketolase
MSAMLYAQQTLLGNFSIEDIKEFRQWGSPTPGHPELDLSRGIENTSGPLGLGHAFGAGSAIAERFLVSRFGSSVEHQTYIYISDGGIQEEISQGVGRIAGFLGLGNIIMFYDANDIQLSTKVEEVTGENTAAKYQAWNWHVLEIDGHDHEQIRQALMEGKAEKERPTLIIGKTIIGKGAVRDDGSSHEGQTELHGKPLGKSNASFAKTILNLGGNPEHPFTIFDDVITYYDEVLRTKRENASNKKAAFEQWKSENPDLGEKFEGFVKRKIMDIDWGSISYGDDLASRNASGAALSHLAEKVDNMIVASADLSNSDMTEKFLKKTQAFKHHDFQGAFLQAGVAELTMAALAIGMTLHGGVIAACGTFFAFSDYMKPAIRLAALMEQPAIFIWTHDAFRVGEDGPTHQPVEQEAQIRLLEKLQNHSGQNSLVALRPADSAETLAAWKYALSNKNRPTGLILSRQNIVDIPPIEDSRLDEAMEGLYKGAYIVKDNRNDPDIILLASGSEVSTLMAGASLLEERKGLHVRVVSVPSEGLFKDQAPSYQQQVLPEGVPVFGLTAGLSVTLDGLVGSKGKVFGLNHFGYSAPAAVLDEKLGFTAENVYRQVTDFLSV